MKEQLNYGTTAKVFHWAIVALLVIQYSLGWLMPHIPDEMSPRPGAAMTWHISSGSTILTVMVVRLFWRLTHPVAAESSVAPWQRIIAEAVHWLLYVLVLLTTLSGWLSASARGFKISWFFLAPMPMLTAGNRALADRLNGWHENFQWALLIVVALHVAAGFVHLFYYQDSVMRRMLPARSRH